MESNLVFNGWHDIKARDTKFFRTVVSAAQRDWEIVELINIYTALKPLRVLEIGSWHGGTLYHWLKNVQPGGVVVNIDNLSGLPLDVWYATVQRWKSWKPDGVEFYSIIGDSDDKESYRLTHEYLKDGIDFIFIDGDHSYEMAKSDFDMYGPLVRKGGIIALHDITKEFAGNATTPIDGDSIL